LADDRRPLDGRQPHRIRRQCLGHAATPSGDALALAGAGEDASMSFGGLHTDHRAIVAVAVIVVFVLTRVMAILPALREPAFSDRPIATPRDEVAARGRQVYMREGCGFCHTQFVRDLPMDRPYGRPSRPGDYVLEDPPMLGTQRTGPD